MTFDFDVYATAYTVRQGMGDTHRLSVLDEVCRHAEEHGISGLLAFYNHHNLDPWLVASTIMERTASLVPLVAVQPYAAPPFTVAQMVYTLTTLHGRRVDLNLITGATGAELAQIGEGVDHDERYERAREYIDVVRALLSQPDALSYEGRHYRYNGLRVNGALDPSLMPRVFVAGSSPASLATARAVADVAVTHPEPVARFAAEYADRLAGGPRIGIRVGLVARPTDEQAWAAARENYRGDRAMALTTAMKRTSGSDWVRRMATLATEGDVYDNVYWTGAYRSNKGSVPLLVGSYATVAAYLARYFDAGVELILLGNASSAADFQHARTTFSLVAELRAG